MNLSFSPLIFTWMEDFKCISFISLMIKKSNRALLEFRFATDLTDSVPRQFCISFTIHFLFTFTWKIEKLVPIINKYPLK